MATSRVKPKSPTQDLLDDFSNIIDRAAETMSEKEFREAERKAKELAIRSSAAPSRRPKTA